MKTIFRQVAVARLASPEELDRLLQITTPKGWVALTGIALLTVAGVVWSCFERLPDNLIARQCILVKNGGINTLTFGASGKLSDLSVDVGDTVTRGQIIGRLEQNDQLQKIRAAEARYQELQLQYATTLAQTSRSGVLRSASNVQQGDSLQAQFGTAGKREKLIEARIDSQAKLYDEGLVTKQTVIASQLELAGVRLEKDNLVAQSKQLELARLEASKQSDNEVLQIKNQLEDSKRTLGLMIRDAASFAEIISPYNGRVLELKAVEGQVVERGTPLVSIESSGLDVNELEAFVYLPATDGKKIRRGMAVQISPSTAKAEEFGYLPAYVASVADYPSTDQGLMRVFGNEKLVQQLAGTTAPIQIRAALQPSAANVSRYRWSTRRGPPFSIQSGTSCSATITTANQRPIELLVPMLKKSFGFD